MPRASTHTDPWGQQLIESSPIAGRLTAAATTDDEQGGGNLPQATANLDHAEVETCQFQIVSGMDDGYPSSTEGSSADGSLDVSYSNWEGMETMDLENSMAFLDWMGNMESADSMFHAMSDDETSSRLSGRLPRYRSVMRNGSETVIRTIARACPEESISFSHCFLDIVER
jgi:hypothetical protein